MTDTVMRGETRWLVVTPASSSATGKMTRRFFKTEKEATKALGNLQKAITERGKEAAAAPAVLVHDGLRARRLLDEAGVSFDLVKVVQEWLATRAREERSCPVPEAVRHWLDNPKRERRDSSQRDVKRLGDRFSTVFGDKLFSNLDPAEVLAFVANFTKSKSPGAFNRTLRLLGGLFRHAERYGWTHREMVQAINRPRTITAATTENTVGVLKADELEKLLRAAGAVDAPLVDYIAVLALAGVRPEEAARLTFSHFKPDDRQFEVPAGAAKTRKRRVVPIEPALHAWLSRPGGFYSRAGLNTGEKLAGCGKGALPSRMKQVKRLAGYRVQAKGLPAPAENAPRWPHDGLRHTFASAFVALRPDEVAKLTFTFGHTGNLDTLRRHYVGAYTSAEAKEWFAVSPRPALMGAVSSPNKLVS